MWYSQLVFTKYPSHCANVFLKFRTGDFTFHTLWCVKPLLIWLLFTCSCSSLETLTFASISTSTTYSPINDQCSVISKFFHVIPSTQNAAPTTHFHYRIFLPTLLVSFSEQNIPWRSLPDSFPPYIHRMGYVLTLPPRSTNTFGIIYRFLREKTISCLLYLLAPFQTQ